LFAQEKTKTVFHSLFKSDGGLLRFSPSKRHRGGDFAVKAKNAGGDQMHDRI